MLFRCALTALLLLVAGPAFAASEAADIVCETTTTTGTGTVNLAGAVSNYATFVSQVASGNTVPYHIRASDSKLETGLGVFTDGTPDTLTRVADWSTDGSGAELTLPAGTHTVCIGPIARLFNSPQLWGNLDLLGKGFVDSTNPATVSLNLGNADYAQFSIQNTSAGSGGPIMEFYANSASGEDGDDIGYFEMFGNSDTAVKVRYGAFGSYSIDSENGAEDGAFFFNTTIAGNTGSQAMLLGDGVIFGSGSTFPGLGNIRLTNIELGADTDTTIARTAAGRASLEGAQIELAGTQMIYVPAAAMISRATSGADCSKTFDSGAADNTIRVCGFDTGADEWAHFTISMPPRWNEGTITAQYVWTTGGASTPGETVSIDISCVAISDDDGLNNALGTPINVDDTMLSADLDLMTSAVSSAVTCAGTPAANDTVQFGVMRDISDDNVAADMDLIGVRLFITTDTANDG
jgi:hypothetical protein